MSDESSPSRDVLWKMYQEHCTQGRHHEIQRSTVISSVIAVAAAVLGLVTFDKGITRVDLPLTLFLVVLGVFGAGFSMKHYERFSLHMERARRYRDALDALLPGQPLKRFKKEADSAHEQKFPRLHKLRLHYWWISLNLIVAGIGLTLSAVAIWWPQKAS